MGYLISFLISFGGSMLSLIIWFHYDLEGFLITLRHKRTMRIGQKHDNGELLSSSDEPKDPKRGTQSSWI